MNTCYRLKTYDMVPRGLFQYRQTEGIDHEFRPKMTIEDQARAVARFRANNGLPRATLPEAIADIDCFTCARMDNDSVFCIPADPMAVDQAVALNATSPLITPCASCGAKV